MAIKKCCTNCVYCEYDLICINNKDEDPDYCIEYDYEFFVPKEELTRKDEREKIIELIKNDRVEFDFEDNCFNYECHNIYNTLKERLINKIKED